MRTAPSGSGEKCSSAQTPSAGTVQPESRRAGAYATVRESIRYAEIKSHARTSRYAQDRRSFRYRRACYRTAHVPRPPSIRQSFAPALLQMRAGLGRQSTPILARGTCTRGRV
jgi:hypothetical protein